MAVTLRNEEVGALLALLLAQSLSSPFFQIYIFYHCMELIQRDSP
jgi:hypothetical protein